MPYVKYCMQDTGRIWHTVFCVRNEIEGCPRNTNFYPFVLGSSNACWDF